MPMAAPDREALVNWALSSLIETGMANKIQVRQAIAVGGSWVGGAAARPLT